MELDFSACGGFEFGEAGAHIRQALSLGGIADEIGFLERVGRVMVELLQREIGPVELLPVLAHERLGRWDKVLALEHGVLVEKFGAPWRLIG